MSTQYPNPNETSGVTALLASELRYRRLFESAKDGILILDADTGMIVDVNPFLTDLLGYSHAEFRGKKIWELGFFKNLAANEGKFAELQASAYSRYDNLPLETADGRKIDVEFVSNVYLVGGQRVIQCNIRDITERKRAADALREQKEELQHWYEVTLGREGRVLELKQEVNALLAQMGQPPRYKISADSTK
jgi:two-component system CheB/CheR fusion protein